MNINGSNLRRRNLIKSSAGLINFGVANQYRAHEREIRLVTEAVYRSKPARV